jgi:multiple sugar transport system permease protein
MAVATEKLIAPLAQTRLGARVRESLVGYGFVLLPMGIFAVFFLYPMGYAIYISFFNWGVLGKIASVGTGNYVKLYHDHIFWIAIRNTFEYAVVVVPLEMALGLLLALIINQKIHGRTFFRAAFYFPSLVSSAAITSIAIYILNANGLLNRIVGGHRSWFGDEKTALWAIVGLNAWTTAGTVMIFYLAAMQSIPTDVYEAAALDGTSEWRTFWRITFPLLRPAHFFVIVVFGIGALKIFDQAFIVSQGTGGPNYATTFGVLYIYLQAFRSLAFGYAATVGVAMFVVIFLLTVIQRLTIGRTEIGG